MAYYNRNYRKRTKKYDSKNRMLRKNCPVHGELVGYTSSYDISPVYEALNPETNKVEHKCFKCLEEPINKESGHNSLVRHKVEKEGHKKFGRKECFFELLGNSFMTIGFLGVIFTWFFSFGILKAFALGAFFFVMFILSHQMSAKFEKQRTEYIKKNTSHLKPVPDAREIMRKEADIVKTWGIEQVQLRKEEERLQLEVKLAWIKRMEFSLEEVDKMDGLDFEILVKNLLKGNGYEIPKITKASGDQGVDIITYKDGKKIAIQCKRYKSKIPNTAVQEVYSGKNYYDCQEAYVITNSYFTPSAVELAQKNQVKLIDRQDLFHMMENAKAEIDESYIAYQTELKFES